MLSPQFVASLQRSVILFLIAAAAVGQGYFLDQYNGKEAIAALFGALTVVLGRFLVEGGYDTLRDKFGLVSKGDVTKN